MEDHNLCVDQGIESSRGKKKREQQKESIHCYWKEDIIWVQDFYGNIL